MKNIAVIGAGAMGNGIAHTFAQAGFKVQLIDVNESALTTALATISKNLDRLVAKDKISETDKTETLDNISTFTTITEGVEYASLVVEAATENVDLKLKIFKQLDVACPEDTILATNTSSISITQIASVTSRPKQVIGMHFMNPVPLMPLVEIIHNKICKKKYFISLFYVIIYLVFNYFLFSCFYSLLLFTSCMCINVCLFRFFYFKNRCWI